MIEHIKNFFGKDSGGGKPQDTPNDTSYNPNTGEYIIRTNKGDVTAWMEGSEVYLKRNLNSEKENKLKKEDVEEIAEILGTVLTEYHRADVDKTGGKKDVDKTGGKKKDPQESMNELFRDWNEENRPFSLYKNAQPEENDQKKNPKYVLYINVKGADVKISPNGIKLFTPDKLITAINDLNSGVYSSELSKEFEDYGKYFHKIPTTDKKSQ